MRCPSRTSLTLLAAFCGSLMLAPLERAAAEPRPPLPNSAPTATAPNAAPNPATNLATPPKPADVVPPQRKGSGLKVPRFATMRAEEVNVRSGPGTRYPVEWVFQKKGMPVEVVSEFDSWRRIRDWQGAMGWVHQSMLVGKRSLIVTASDATIIGEPRAGAEPVARLEQGVIGEILTCKEQGFCRVRIEGYRGYLARAAVWGLYPDEKIE